jgi:hypothetical protein
VTTQPKIGAYARSDKVPFWKRPAANRALWVIQVLLALLFLFAGSMKLILPIAAMTKQLPLPGLFLRFIGVAEITGAIGLILPWLLGIRRELTWLAASGLVIIMIGATVVTVMTGSVTTALLPFVVGILLVAVAYGRWNNSWNDSWRHTSD